MQVTFTACSHFYSVAHKVRVLSTQVLHILLVFSGFFLQQERAATFLQYKKEPKTLNVTTTPITAMGCEQCLPLSVVQLKGKHCIKPHYRNGVVDTVRLGGISINFDKKAVS